MPSLVAGKPTHAHRLFSFKISKMLKGRAGGVGEYQDTGCGPKVWTKMHLSIPHNMLVNTSSHLWKDGLVVMLIFGKDGLVEFLIIGKNGLVKILLWKGWAG